MHPLQILSWGALSAFGQQQQVHVRSVALCEQRRHVRSARCPSDSCLNCLKHPFPRGQAFDARGLPCLCLQACVQPARLVITSPGQVLEPGLALAPLA